MHNYSIPRYNEAATRLAWQRTTAFFKENLFSRGRKGMSTTRTLEEFRAKFRVEELKVMKNLVSKSCIKNLVWLIVEASESAKDFGGNKKKESWILGSQHFPCPMSAWPRHAQTCKMLLFSPSQFLPEKLHPKECIISVNSNFATRQREQQNTKKLTQNY